MQIIQLDTAGFLDRLYDQLQMLMHTKECPTSDLFSVLASIKYFEQVLTKYQTGSYGYGASIGNKAVATTKNEINRV